MALADLIKDHRVIKEQEILEFTEERIRAIIPIARQYISFWRMYPDIFVDFLAGNLRKKEFTSAFEEDSTFHFYYYQRVFMRAAMRKKYLYATYARGYSKSFLSILILMIRCILYPGAHLFVTAGGKSQAADIIKEKVQDLCKMIPALEKEIDYGPHKTSFTKDYAYVCFKNGSWFDNVAASERSRGKRRHGGVVEECVSVDGDILHDVIIPTMNVSRICANGERNEDEALNKSQIFITTAGYKNTFPYDKLIQIAIGSVLEPDKYCVMGGSWKIPVLAGLQDKNFIKDLKKDSTFNEASFDREYNSIWSGSSEDAFFTGEDFDKNRTLNSPENEGVKSNKRNFYYVLTADIGRKGCDTVVHVLKVFPQKIGVSMIHLVNTYTYSDMHIEDQVIEFKRLYFKFLPQAFVIDGNGIGINYIDLMVKSQVDDMGEVYPPFGIINDKDNYYKKYLTADTIQNVLYIVKAHAADNTEAHGALQTRMKAGRIKFLIDPLVAKTRLLSTKIGQTMRPEDREAYLRPFTYASMLKDEMMNLREENDGANIILKRVNNSIQKDKFSALEYGCLYIKRYEQDTRGRKSFKVEDFMFYT